MSAADIEYEELCELRDLWLSRVMFGWILGPPWAETRSFEEFLDAARPAPVSSGPTEKERGT